MLPYPCIGVHYLNNPNSIIDVGPVVEKRLYEIYQEYTPASLSGFVLKHYKEIDKWINDYEIQYIEAEIRIKNKSNK